VQAKAAGFKTYVVRGIGLEALRTVRVDVRLEVGEVGTEVTIQGAAPVIETDTASIAAVRTAKDLNDLPLNIRSTVSGTGDSGIVPLCVSDSDGRAGRRIAIQSRAVRAGRRITLMWTAFRRIRRHSVIRSDRRTPSFESIQEVRFEIVNNKAEFGEVANITAITKSGT
jgi:hypothetical protein